jgi:glycogen(starch) synthase
MRIFHFAATETTTNIQGNHRHIAYLAGAQRARGMDANVVTSKHGLISNLYKQDGIPTFVVDDLLADELPKGEDVVPGAGISTQEIVARLKDFNPEIIHCHDLHMGQVVVTAANIIKVPCVVTLHETGIDSIISEFFARKRAGLKFTLITVSKREFDVMQDRGMAGAGITFHYVPNGTPVGTQKKQGPPHKPNLIMVARLGFVKGVDIAILAMVELRRRHRSDCPVLNIYGAGDLGEYLIEMVKVLRIGDVVKFHGIQMNVLSKCSSSDVLVVASRFETGPLVIPEAMSRGMPIVACNVGQVTEMLPDKRYGRVVPVNSITELADAIDSMLTDIASGRFNPDLLVKRHQSQYSIEMMADRTAAIYESAIAELELV